MLFDVLCFKCHSYLISINITFYLNFVRILKWFCRIIIFVILSYCYFHFLFYFWLSLLLGPRPKSSPKTTTRPDNQAYFQQWPSLLAWLVHLQAHLRFSSAKTSCPCTVRHICMPRRNLLVFHLAFLPCLHPTPLHIYCHQLHPTCIAPFTLPPKSATHLHNHPIPFFSPMFSSPLRRT